MATRKSAYSKLEAADKTTPADRKLNAKALKAVSKVEELVEGIKDSQLFQWALAQMQYNIQKRVKVTGKKK